MRKLILLLLFSYFLLSFGFADGEEQLAGDEISLVLDLEASFYTFGLSSNPINSATTQPNDVVPTLQPVGSEGNIIGVMGGIQGNENDNELHFYWNVSSPLEFSVFIGVDTSGEGEGAMKKVAGTGAGSYLDWTISVVGETEQIKKGEYGQKILLYHHNPEVERISYSSKEIQIYTEIATPGTYNGNLVFSISMEE